MSLSTKIKILAITLPLLACSDTKMTEEECRDYFIEEVVYPTKNDVYRNYRVDGATPNLGIRYDNNGRSLSADDELKIEEIVSQVYECLHDTFPDKIMSQEDKAKFYCYYRGGIYTPSYSEFVVVISPYWRKSCYSEEQVLSNAVIPDDLAGGCATKGMNNPNCTCVWRSIFRRANDGTALFITTPSMYMLSDAMTRWMTGCGNPWVSDVEPPLIECARPIVPQVP